MEPVPKNFNFNWLVQQLNYLNELSEDLNSMSIGEITFECNMIVKVTVLHINFHWKKIKLLFNVLGEIIGTACTDLSLPVWSHHFLIYLSQSDHFKLNFCF